MESRILNESGFSEESRKAESLKNYGLQGASKRPETGMDGRLWPAGMITATLTWVQLSSL